MATQLTWRSSKDPRCFLATGFGIGYIKYAPGTCASVLAVVIWWLWLSEYRGFYQMAIILAIGLFATYCVATTLRQNQVGDDPAITADEIIGQWVALVALPKVWWLALLAFGLFRLLDIMKPDPIGWFDRRFKGPGGVMLDDVVAGAIVVAVMHALVFWLEVGV